MIGVGTIAKVLGGLLVARMLAGGGGGQSIARIFWQGAAPWGGKVLGNATSVTIAAAGCLLTCLTMALNALLGEDLTPGEVNDGLVSVAGCFVGADLALERAADELGMTAPESLRIHPSRGAGVEQLRARIRETLSKGGLAIVHVGASAAAAGFHFILIHAERGGSFVAADPATAQDVNLSTSTLQATVMWGSTPRTYTVVGVAPIFKA